MQKEDKKTLATLVQDIYASLERPAFDPDKVEAFGKRVADMIVRRLSEPKGQPELRMSNLGTPCDRKLWYSINQPEKGEPLPGHVRLKFLKGDIAEEVNLFLDENSGHKVEGVQDELLLYGVKGHRDAIIDGVTVDVKSASPFGFDKFRNHGLERDDAFGYLTQLGGYVASGKDDPRVEDKTGGAFLADNKVNGRLVVDYYKLPKRDWELEIEQKRAMLSGPMPGRDFGDVPDGKSGNRKLQTVCSYCPFKSVCWPGLRAFNYAGKPTFLTKVEREPRVPEIKVEEAVEIQA